MELELLKFTLADFNDYYRLVGNIEVMAMITERALPTDEAKTDFEMRLKSNGINKDFGYFKIVDRSSDTFIGLAKLEIEQNDSIEAEIGYMILPEYWGKGIGTRVARQLIDKSEKLSQLHKLYAIIDPHNMASRKILTNHGFTSKEFRNFDGLPGELLERKMK